MGICQETRSESFIWSRIMKDGNIMVADIYTSICGRGSWCVENPLLYAFWNTSIPIKIIFFSSLVYHNKNLTWENLQKQN